MNLTCNCSGTFLIFQSSEFKNVSEMLNRTAELFVSPVPPAPPRKPETLSPLELTFLLVVLVFVCAPVIFVVRSSIKEAKLRMQRYLSVGSITVKPVIPWTLSASEKEVRLSGGVRFECKTFTKQFLEKGGGECPKYAIDWLQSIIKPAVFIPETARIISVPMKNFKCGQEPTDFEPISGAAPGSRFTYQMCGDNRIQITRYVEDDVEYVAGYCVYLPGPYSSSEPYQRVHIDNCYTGVQYEQILEVDTEESHRTLTQLKLKFCETLQKPVMIGLDSGVVKHFEWLISSYQVQDCPSCKLEEWNDYPPPYHLLDV